LPFKPQKDIKKGADKLQGSFFEAGENIDRSNDKDKIVETRSPSLRAIMLTFQLAYDFEQILSASKDNSLEW
jgi:hypothetical protein